MQPTRILETSLYADDLEAMEEFYTRILGLAFFSKVEGRHVFLRCGAGMLLIFNPTQTNRPNGSVPPHGTSGAGHVAFAIAADSLDNWRDHLNRHGVRIEKEHTWPTGGRSLYFRDPAGNSIELATPQTWNFAE